MITLKWALFPEAENIESFNIYRSIIGFVAPIRDLTGKTLELKLNGDQIFNVAFTGSDPISDINAVIKGGSAYIHSDPNYFTLRSDMREAPGSIEIIGGTSLTDLGLTKRLITEKSEDLLIANVVNDSDDITYADQDGAIQDWYAVSTVNNLSEESSKTNYRQPITATGPVCVIEGVVIDPQGKRIPDAEVIATLQIPPGQDCSYSTMTKEPVKVYSGPDGRFGLPLLQGILVRLDIPTTGFTKMITVPASNYVFLNMLEVDLDYKFEG